MSLRRCPEEPWRAGEAGNSRPTPDRRRRPRGGRVEDGRLVRVQQPGATEPGYGHPDPRRRLVAGISAASRGPDADPGPHPDAWPPDPPGSLRRLREPIL